jgi:hypothetical protein
MPVRLPPVAPRGSLVPVPSSVLHAPPTRIRRQGVAVLEQTTADELPRIQAAWHSFERLVGLRGRKMFARVDEDAGTYTVCTPINEGDNPDALGLQVGTLPGGWYLRGHLVGDPSEIYQKIGAGMTELRRAMPPEPARPLVEFYRRHDHVELWLPIRP